MLTIEKPTGAQELVIFNWLEANAGEELTEKINNGKKTFKQCFEYIRRKARGLAVNGCAMVEDSTVFGWAKKYFEDDAVQEDQGAKTAVEEKDDEEIPDKEPKKKKEKQKPATENEALSIFDLL